MDKCREEFERWVIENNKSISIPNFIMKDEGGSYKDQYTTLLWQGWKSSRESMKAIKLPELMNICTYSEYDDGISTGFNDAIGECKEAITSAGYKVEE